jgi:hypothetical membrane protein
VIAEIFYPTNYSISQNMISNLGATPPPNSIIHQPSATIFDMSMLLAGGMVLAGAYFLNKITGSTLTALSIAILGAGTFCVGIFPANHVVTHPISALVAFVGGGISALLSAKMLKGPFAFIAILLGLFNLTFLFLGLVLPETVVPFLGRGGTERLVVYPLVLWLTGFGGYLMGTKEGK